MLSPQKQFSRWRNETLRVSAAILAFNVILAVGLVYLPSTHAQQKDKKQSVALEVGKPIESQITSGQTQRYAISASGGQYIRIVVEQFGIDVAVAVFTSDGKKLVEIDSSNGTHGNEIVSIIAETSGAYRIEVHSSAKDPARGKYAARIEELRAATEQDKKAIAAQTLFIAGEQLRAQEDAESVHKALTKYKEALAFYRDMGDQRGEAKTLYRIGHIYSAFGEMPKMLDSFSHALPLVRAVGDRGRQRSPHPLQHRLGVFIIGRAAQSARIL